MCSIVTGKHGRVFTQRHPPTQHRLAIAEDLLVLHHTFGAWAHDVPSFTGNLAFSRDLCGEYATF